MFGNKDKVKIALDKYERGLIVNALYHFRNEVLKKEGPTEDIDSMLLKLIKIDKKEK